MRLQEFLESVTLGQETMITVAKKDGKTDITLGQRALQAEPPLAPTRAETPRRCHSFLTADSLGLYLKKYGNADTVVYADSDKNTVTAILKETAVDGVEALTMTPKVHPAAAPWRQIAGATVDLETFLSVVLLNRRAVMKPVAIDLIHILSHLKGTKKVEVQRGRGTDHLNGVMVQVEIQGQLKKDLVEIPETMQILVPLYHGTPSMKIDLDLTVDGIVKDDGLEVFVRVSGTQWREAELASFEAMIGKVQEIAGKNVGLTVLGSPNHTPWTYLK